MNDSARVTRRPRRAWLPDVLTAAAIIATVALALLVAACGGSPSSTGGSPAAGGAANSPSAVAYSHCMRANGVPNFPDPPSNGQVPKTSAQVLGVSGSALQAAQQACRRLYPGNGGALTKASIQQCEETGYCPQALVRQAVTAMLGYARCMRSHGLPGWPDPTVDSEGRPGFNLLHVHGFNPNSAQVSAKMQGCEHVMPAGVPVPVIAPAPG